MTLVGVATASDDTCVWLTPIGRVTFREVVLFCHRTPLHFMVGTLYKDFRTLRCLAHFIFVEVAAIFLVATVPRASGRPVLIVVVPFIVVVLRHHRHRKHHDDGEQNETYESITHRFPPVSKSYLTTG